MPIDPQAASGLTARIVHLTALVAASDPRPDLVRSELLDLVVDLVPGTRWATLTRHDGTVPGVTTSASGPVGAMLDQLQREEGCGPAPDAVATRDAVVCDDLARESRWLGFTARAVQGTPARSVCSYPMTCDHQLGTTLTLYGDEPGAYAGDRLPRAILVSAFAGLVLAGNAGRGSMPPIASAG